MNTKKWSAMAALALCLCAVQQHAVAGLAEGMAAMQKTDYGVALKELTPEAERGNAEAQFQLGTLYGQGLGVDQDAVAAFKWNQMAANAGNAGAQYQIATMYKKGEGVPQDNALATQWLRKSADGRYALALQDLGSAYQSGAGVKADKLLALALFNLSNFSDNLSPNKKISSSFVLAKDLTGTEVKRSWTIFCVLGNAKSLISALDAYVANPKGIPANACAANSAK